MTLAATDAWAGAEKVIDESACPTCGLENCEGHVEHTDERHTVVDAAVLVASRAIDLIDVPSPQDIIEGIASEGSVTVFVAESGTGKTFVLLAASAAVSDNVAFIGRRVMSGSVAFITFEGDAFGTRLRALRDKQSCHLEHVYIVRATSPISPQIARDGELVGLGERYLDSCLAALSAKLAKEGLPPLKLVVIDTARASMAGSEDNSADVSAYLRACRRIMRRFPDAALVLSHHAGWQDGDTQRKRERGSSAWRGNCDITLYLEAGPYDSAKGEAELTLRTLKSRDGELLPPMRMIRRRVELDTFDRYGARRTSCVILPDHTSRADREAREVAIVEADAKDLDLKVLAAIIGHPDIATNREGIRTLVGRAKSDVSSSIDRCIRAGWLKPGRRGEPFVTTPEGRLACLQGGQP